MRIWRVEGEPALRRSLCEALKCQIGSISSMVHELFPREIRIRSEVVVRIISIEVFLILKIVFPYISKHTLSDNRGVSSSSITSGNAKSHNVILLSLCKARKGNSILYSPITYFHPYRIYM